ncbi:hypothetical protein JW851_01305 [Candidatus Woesearchaeota archaeon]|nr:hypothetical protein [Candidatus Woesearchaeota archaeon]
MGKAAAKNAAQEVLSGLEWSRDIEEFTVAFLIANAYDFLEEIVEQVKAIPVTVVPQDKEYPPRNGPRQLKLALVEDVLLPKERYQEAAAILEECKEFKRAFAAVKNTSPEKTAEFCERTNGFFTKGLSLISKLEEGEKKKTIEERLQKAHIKALIEGNDIQYRTNNRCLPDMKWHAALNKAREYGFPDAELCSIRDMGLEDLLQKLDSNFRYYEYFELYTDTQNRISAIKKLLENYSPEEMPEVKKRFLDILSKHSVYHSILQAHNIGFTERVWKEAEVLASYIMPSGGINNKSILFERAENFIETNILPSAEEDKVKWYIKTFILTDCERACVLAKRYNLQHWLIDIYKEQQNYTDAAQASEKLCLDIPIDLLISGGFYYRAAERSNDPYKKAEIMLTMAENYFIDAKKQKFSYQEKEIVDWGIRSLSQVLEEAKKGKSIKKAVEFGVVCINLLIKHDLYVQAVLFNRTHECMERVPLPNNALADTEAKYDFDGCAVLCEELCMPKDAAAYKFLAENSPDSKKLVSKAELS